MEFSNSLSRTVSHSPLSHDLLSPTLSSLPSAALCVPLRRDRESQTDISRPTPRRHVRLPQNPPRLLVYSIAPLRFSLACTRSTALYPQVASKGMEQHIAKKTNDSKIRLRHALETTWIVEINSLLTDAQRSRLNATPFKWVMEMESSIKLSGPLLRELVTRWDKRSGGFRIRGKVVSFTTLDVCFAIGLPIVGEPVCLDDSGDCRVKQLFKGKKDLTVRNIVEKCKDLSDEDEVEDFYRVYILLAFSVLYFPRTTSFVFSVPFRLLDDLDALWEYNWGVAVYDFLVNSLNNAASNYSMAKNSAQLHIAGCAAILQIWAVEHLSLRPTSAITCFPRINLWTPIEGGNKKLEAAFKDNRVVEVLDRTGEERQHLVLFEAINEAEGGFQLLENLKPEMEDFLVEHKMLLAQNKQFQTRISFVEGEMNSIKKMIVEQGSVATKQSVGDGVENEVPLTPPMESVALTTVVVNESHKQQNGELLKQLYRFCTRRTTKNPNQILVKMFDVYATADDLQSMRPTAWLSNLVMYLAVRALMEDEKQRSGVISRFIFSSGFADNVIGELGSFEMGQQKNWSKRTICALVGGRSNPLDQIRQCNLIFAPALYEQHWSCYVLDQDKKKIFVLDSFHDERTESLMLLDKAMRQRFEDLLGLLYPMADRNDLSLDITYEVLPQQHNCDDCGIYVLKYLEMWDGVAKWDDSTMPYWTPDDVAAIRRELVCRWVLHPKNEMRETVLGLAGLPKDLVMCSPLGVVQ